MDNVTTFQVTQPNGEAVDYVLIDKGDGNFASLLKSEYDTQQAEQSTPNLTGE
jgi:hypothetical protein